MKKLVIVALLLCFLLPSAKATVLPEELLDAVPRESGKMLQDMAFSDEQDLSNIEPRGY